MEKNGEKAIIYNDLSEYIAAAIANSLDKVHEAWYKVIENPMEIFTIQIELHSIWKKIHSSLKNDNRHKEIDEQKNLHSRISKLTPIVRDKRLDNGGQVRKVFVRSNEFAECRDLLEEREMHIYECLEIVGLMPKQIKIHKRVI
jgi:RNA binding exosome subunit